MAIDLTFLALRDECQGQEEEEKQQQQQQEQEQQQIPDAAGATTAAPPPSWHRLPSETPLFASILREVLLQPGEGEDHHQQQQRRQHNLVHTIPGAFQVLTRLLAADEAIAGAAAAGRGENSNTPDVGGVPSKTRAAAPKADHHQLRLQHLEDAAGQPRPSPHNRAADALLTGSTALSRDNEPAGGDHPTTPGNPTSAGEADVTAGGGNPYMVPIASLSDVRRKLLPADTPRRVCQYAFLKNDIVWICKACQADETCVLCNDCFRSSDHEGHEVYFYHAQVPVRNA